MFHLLVQHGLDSWGSSPAKVHGERFLEYTNDEISNRFSKLNNNLIKELKEFPALFLCEAEESPTFAGNITDIVNQNGNLLIHFQRIQDIPPFEIGVIPAIASELGIRDFEFHRSHWAIKDKDLYSVLLSKGVLTEQQVATVNAVTGNVIVASNSIPKLGAEFNDQQIFIVHGHDDLAKNDVRNYVTDIGKEPIILHMQASGGRTIIEKIDYYSNVGFAIVLYTECDVGAKRDSLNFKRRARQNVIFEHGYLIGKINRSRVVALVKGDVETPNDISGVVYVQMDDEENWKKEINNELRNCGYL